MTHLDDAALDELARLAGEATPGPWAARTDYPDDDRMWWILAPENSVLLDRVPVSSGAEMTDENAAYIAAANPATVAALVAEVRRLRAALSAIVEDGVYLDVYETARAALDGGQ